MNPLAGAALFVTVLVWAVGTAAPPASLGSPFQPTAAVRGTLQFGGFEGAPGSPDAAPSASGAAPASAAPTLPPLGAPPDAEPNGSPQTQPAAPVAPAPGVSPLGTSPSPSTAVPSASAAGRFHLHRPGTDVDGDLLTGSLASHVFILKGNVVLHSDPKIDREMAEASESDEPLSVTADEIDVDQLAFTYVAKGHVHFVQGSRSGFADLATLNEEARTLDLVGNASVLDGEHRTTAAKMHYNTADKQFVGAGDVRIYAPAPTPNPSTATPPPKHKRRLPL
jgi:hypothetical protein